MIEHCLPNKNERATVAQIPKFSELNTLLTRILPLSLCSGAVNQPTDPNPSGLQLQVRNSQPLLDEEQTRRRQQPAEKHRGLFPCISEHIDANYSSKSTTLFSCMFVSSVHVCTQRKHAVSQLGVQ